MLVQFGSYQAGGLGSLGWVVGGLIFCLGSVIEADSPPAKSQGRNIRFRSWRSHPEYATSYISSGPVLVCNGGLAVERG